MFHKKSLTGGTEAHGGTGTAKDPLPAELRLLAVKSQSLPQQSLRQRRVRSHRVALHQETSAGVKHRRQGSEGVSLATS